MKKKLACIMLLALLLSSCGPTTQIGYNTNCACSNSTDSARLVLVDETKHSSRTVQKIYHDTEANIIYIISYYYTKDPSGFMYMTESKTEIYPFGNEKGNAK